MDVLPLEGPPQTTGENICRNLATEGLSFLTNGFSTNANGVPPSMYYHRLCTTTVYVLPPSMYYHHLCTTTVYVLVTTLSMYYHRRCTTTVYVLPLSMYYHRLCTTTVYVLLSGWIPDLSVVSLTYKLDETPVLGLELL